MSDTLCFNKTFFILVVLSIVIILGYQLYLLKNQSDLYALNNNNKCKPCNVQQEEHNPMRSQQYLPQQPQQQQPTMYLPGFDMPMLQPALQPVEQMRVLRRDYHTPAVDPVREYDYRKAYDPLEEPTRRVNRYELPRVHFKRSIDMSTRGYPDSFIQLGVLVRELDSDFSQDNRILRLFGRQEYPGSNKYDYYTGINSGNDQIKVPLNVKRKKELYDGDTVYVKELNNSYKVQLHKYDAPKYYPDLV